MECYQCNGAVSNVPSWRARPAISKATLQLQYCIISLEMAVRNVWKHNVCHPHEQHTLSLFLGLRSSKETKGIATNESAFKDCTTSYLGITKSLLTTNSLNKLHYILGRDNSVGIATRYGLDVPGIEPRWGRRDFSAPVQTGSTSHPAIYTMGTGPFRGGKMTGAWL